MKFEDAINFDSTFVTARINECLSICESQLKYGCDVAGLFEKSFKQGLSWLYNHCSNNGFSEDQIIEFEDNFMTLRLQRLAQVSNENQSEQVFTPATSKQLLVFRVLGQVSKINWIYQVNTSSDAKAPCTAQFFPNSRPVGGLGQ